MKILHAEIQYRIRDFILFPRKKIPLYCNLYLVFFNI